MSDTETKASVLLRSECDQHRPFRDFELGYSVLYDLIDFASFKLACSGSTSV